MKLNREKVFITISALVFVGLLIVAVHQIDNYNYKQHQKALAAQALHDKQIQESIKRAELAKEQQVYDICVASQTAYDKQVAAVKAKTTRPVCLKTAQ